LKSKEPFLNNLEMAIIEKDKKVFVFADAPITMFEGGALGIDEQDLPNNFGKSQTFYGETSDAPTQPKDRLWQPASLIGTTTGRTTVYKDTLYYQVNYSATFRESGGWASGTYFEAPRVGWASSADITDSPTSALEKYNKRTDKATKSEVEKNQNEEGFEKTPEAAKDNANTKLPTGKTGTTQSNLLTPTDEKSKPNYLLWGLGAFGVILIGVGLWWAFGTKKEAAPVPNANITTSNSQTPNTTNK
jgi:hypothetical protein